MDWKTRKNRGRKRRECPDTPTKIIERSRRSRVARRTKVGKAETRKRRRPKNMIPVVAMMRRK